MTNKRKEEPRVVFHVTPGGKMGGKWLAEAGKIRDALMAFSYEEWLSGMQAVPGFTMHLPGELPASFWTPSTLSDLWVVKLLKDAAPAPDASSQSSFTASFGKNTTLFLPPKDTPTTTLKDFTSEKIKNKEGSP